MNKMLSQSDCYAPTFETWKNAFLNIITDKNRNPHRAIESRLNDCYFVFNNLDIQNTDRILEIGAWPTYSYLYAAGLCNSIVVSDTLSWLKREFAIKEKMDVRKWIEDVDAIKNASFQKINAKNIPYKNEFDKIYMVSVLEHIEDDCKALCSIRDALKPDGKLCLTADTNQFVAMPYRKDICFRVYSVDQLLKLISDAGFVLDSEFVYLEGGIEYEAMKEAISNPSLLTIPYRHFGSCGLSLVVKK